MLLLLSGFSFAAKNKLEQIAPSIYCQTIQNALGNSFIVITLPNYGLKATKALLDSKALRLKWKFESAWESLPVGNVRFYSTPENLSYVLTDIDTCQVTDNLNTQVS